MPPPPGGGGAPPPGMEVAASKNQLVKLASDVKSYHQRKLQDGSFRFRPAKSAQEEELRRNMQSCLKDIIRR